MRVGAAKELDAWDDLQQLVELVARRLLDVSTVDALDLVNSLRLGFGKRLPGDDDGGRRGGLHDLENIVEGRDNSKQRGRDDGHQCPGCPPRPR